MKLTVKERIVMLNLLPKEGDFKTLKQLRELRERLAFTDEENKSLDFKTAKEGFITWTEIDPENPYTKDITVGETMAEVISETLQRLDKEKKLNDDTFVLYERFVK